MKLGLSLASAQMAVAGEPGLVHVVIFEQKMI
jgi:hypothetical protein